ncbi:hypothetical protein NPIL_190821 [Nephila pilipes]|uniref:Uncharacterized protein n=1 Tax=Nephila pilipes TaxID=299642 RepID=A0A8X6QTG0_NEPPI|nr:hypothetical protein NPIL_190821 [Nephila pilipes]
MDDSLLSIKAQLLLVKSIKTSAFSFDLMRGQMRRFYEKRQAYVSPHTNVNIPHHFHANSPEAVDQAFTVSNLGFGITSERTLQPTCIGICRLLYLLIT